MPQAETEQVKQIWIDFAESLAPPAGIPEWRIGFDKMCEQFDLAEGATFEQVDAGGVPAILVTVPESDPSVTVQWTHSGGYIFGSAAGYRSFGSQLAKVAGARVLLVDYSLAPEHVYPTCVDENVGAYRWLLAQGAAPGKVVLGGDSAGGGLATATLLALRDAGDPSPAGLVAVSPLTDHTLSGTSMKERADRDPVASEDMLAALGGLYRGDASAEDPYISPIFGDLSGLAPMLVLVGSEEVLHDDSTRLVERTTAAGGDARLLVGEGQAHIWPLFNTILPEGREALGEIGRFVQARAAAS